MSGYVPVMGNHDSRHRGEHEPETGITDVRSRSGHHASATSRRKRPYSSEVIARSSDPDSAPRPSR